MNSGNPVANTGWLQNIYQRPCDIYFLHGCGSFSMAPMDTQRAIYAIIVGYGETRLESVLELKQNTNFIRDVFQSQFLLKAWTETEVRTLSQSEMEFEIRARIETDMGARTVQADLFTYKDSLVQTIDLYDDGSHGDSIAGDFVYSNVFNFETMPEALYLNLRIEDGNGVEHLFSHADENIAVVFPNIFLSSIEVAADHINSDGKINPGENVRLRFGIKNDLPFDINSLNVLLCPYLRYVSAQPKHFFLSNIGVSEIVDINYDPQNEATYYEINVSEDIPAENPTNNRIYLKLKFYANEHYIWDREFSASLLVEPLDYVPNMVIPAHIAGYSSASFEISVIRPDQLTGHAYAITVSDSINEKGDQGFNLIDQSLGDTLLKNHEVPEPHAHNIPITDGVKVIKAFLPEKEFDGYYKQIPGADSRPFTGINFDGNLSKNLVTFGKAPADCFCPVEIEFTNRIDTSGVVEAPLGQGGFQHTLYPVNGIAGFLPCGFNVWKIENGQRTGRLNFIFQEVTTALPTYDETWTPGEWLCIMSSDYDDSGQLYLGLDEIPMDEVLYKLNLALRTQGSFASIGDKCRFQRIFLATEEDMWLFTPTNIQDKNGNTPTSFRLYQNYPNPFNPITTIRFSIAKNSKVSLKIYNILGQEVVELFHRPVGPGSYAVNWDGKDRLGQAVGSGVYFARLESAHHQKSIKLLLIR